MTKICKNCKYYQASALYMSRACSNTKGAWFGLIVGDYASCAKWEAIEV